MMAANRPLRLAARTKRIRRRERYRTLRRWRGRCTAKRSATSSRRARTTPRSPRSNSAMSKSSILENAKDELPATDELVVEVPAGQPFAVRETTRLYRLRATRFQAVVAADTEDEARSLACSRDARGVYWCSPVFASSEFEDTGEAHVFGDVIISALAVPPARRRRKGWPERSFRASPWPGHCANRAEPE